MGVRSFRTGTGQKRRATEKGIYRGRAENFVSTRRTGLSPLPTSAAAGLYQLRIPYHAYGNDIGTLSLAFAPDYNTAYETLQFQKDGGNLISSFSGQQHASDSSPWGELLAQVPTDGVLYFLYVSGTNFAGDIAIDTISIEDPGTGDVLGTITVDYSGGWETNAAKQTSFFTHSTASSLWRTLISTTNNQGSWCVDWGGTPSTGTGPSLDSEGTSSGYYIHAETSNAYAPNYFTLRITDVISSYI